MIKFDHNNGDLKCAVFGGTLVDLCADLCLEMTLIYGAMYKQNKKAADEFRRNMIISLTDPDIANRVFSTEIHDELSKSDHYTAGTITVSGAEELERQLKELLNESE